LTEPTSNEAEGLRIRAARCRDFAREYADDVGSALTDLAVELDKRADRLVAQDERAGVTTDGMIPNNPAPQVGQ
jgi:hypothetical protein